MTQDEEIMIRRMGMLLDACQEHLDREAAAEKRREKGKSLRSITMQDRAEAAREIVAEADALVGGILI